MVIGVFVSFRDYEDREDAERHAAIEAQIVRALEDGIAHDLMALREVRDFVTSVAELDEAVFERFAKGIVARYPSIQAVSWNAHVVAGERDSFERRQGRPIVDLTPSGDLVRAGSRAEYSHHLDRAARDERERPRPRRVCH
ncbi:MAG: CHASE domain-containing protein [Deltaproteobacteria bacterium]|nr:CHASE domain-containing protein [Deltaproteobacteria bacterium]